MPSKAVAPIGLLRYRVGVELTRQLHLQVHRYVHRTNLTLHWLVHVRVKLSYMRFFGRSPTKLLDSDTGHRMCGLV